MPTLLLRRHTPLTPSELARLPGGCVGVRGSGDVIARARIDMPVARLLRFAVAMGRAVPDARFEVEVEAAAEEPGPPPQPQPLGTRPPPPPQQQQQATPAAPPPPAAPTQQAAPAQHAAPTRQAAPAQSTALDRPAAPTPWDTLDDGDLDAIEKAFAGTSLDSKGRDRVRTLLNSTDPAEVAAGCCIARMTGWRSAATQVRRLVRHADTRVRVEAAHALGVLAGPAVVPALEPLLADNSPEVQAAARTAIARLDGPDEADEPAAEAPDTAQAAPAEGADPAAEG